jgi:cysteinyl-tRNA synthetase
LSKLRENYRVISRAAESGEESAKFDAFMDMEHIRSGAVLEAFDSQLEKALDDDMNTAVAVREVLSLSGFAKGLEKHASLAERTLRKLNYWLNVLGIVPDESWLVEPVAELPADFVDRLQRSLNDARVEASLDGATSAEAVERIVELRNEVRRAKDWSASDRLRDVLAQCGVELKDSKEGTTWTVVR